MRVFRAVFVFGIVIIGSGCSHQPSQITAQVPLIDSTAHQSNRLSGDSVELAGGRPARGARIQTRFGEFFVGDYYMSALGVACFGLLPTAHNTLFSELSPVMCNVNEQWQVFLPDLLSGSPE